MTSSAVHVFLSHVFVWSVNPFSFTYVQADTSVILLIFAFIHLVMNILHRLKKIPLFYVSNIFQILEKLLHPAYSTAK